MPEGCLSAAPARVDLIGLHGGQPWGWPATQAMASATVVMGAPRHLATVSRRGPEIPTMTLTGDLAEGLRTAARLARSGERVVILASGDPGFFGLTRLARDILGPDMIRVHPVPSAVSLAFAAMGDHWDDAVVVSAHGRPLPPVLEAVSTHSKVAVLVSPENPPQAIARALIETGCGPRQAFVGTRLGEPDQSIWHGDLVKLAAGEFDPVSVVIFTAPDRPPGPPGWAWGRSDDSYAHREGMITKAEVRAVVLGKLSIPDAGVMWDVGAGSGSVSAECAFLSPGLDVYAIERRPDDLERLRTNLATTHARVVAGAAPESLGELPDPDRVFIGGGGPDVLETCLARLRPGGVVVATYAVMDRAVRAAARLGQMVQISVSRAVPVGPGADLRLSAENPVFICWGPV